MKKGLTIKQKKATQKKDKKENIFVSPKCPKRCHIYLYSLFKYVYDIILYDFCVYCLSHFSHNILVKEHKQKGYTIGNT